MKRRDLLKLVVPLVWTRAWAAPQPLQVIKDICPFCSMTILDARYSAQLLEHSGQVWHYDDLSCLLYDLKNRPRPKELYVADHARSEAKQATYIAVNQAHYLLSLDIPTPMGSGILAFSSLVDLEGYLRVHPQFKTARRLGWAELLRQFRAE